jgi:hypothetical protein
MRRLLALPLVAAALAAPAVPASAEVCTTTTIGFCTSHVGVDPYCHMDSHPRILACDIVEGL